MPVREQRRSQRFQHELLVELHDRRGPRKLYATDVARHGIFLATDDPPRERHLVQLTVHLPGGPIRAAGSVTRTLRGQRDHEDGVGIQFFALSDEAKDRWDDFIFQLQRTTPPRGVPRYDPKNDPMNARAAGADDRPSGAATFLVKLKSVESLRAFAQSHLRAGGTVLFTPVLREAGEVVTLVVVHPKTDEEFRLPGIVHKAHADRPKRLEIHFHGVTPALLNGFAAYIESGHPPRTQLDPPVQLAGKAAPDKELDLDVDVFEDDPLELDERLGAPVPAPSVTPTVTPTQAPTPTRTADGDGAATAPAPSGPADPNLQPRTFRMRCNRDGCAAEPYDVELGPCRGVLGFVANHAAFVSPSNGRVVSSPRLASAEERQARTRSYLDAGGQLDAQVDLTTLLGAVALVEPAKDADGPLKHTRAVERLEHAALRLAAGATARTKVPCPVCKEGHVVVELAAN